MMEDYKLLGEAMDEMTNEKLFRPFFTIYYN